VYRIDVAERRRRLAARHGLAPAARTDDAGDAARQLVALHGTDPASVFLAVRARTATVAPADIEDCLYQRRDLVRMLGMRRTMFVVPAESVPVIQLSTANRIASAQRELLLKLLAETGEVADPESWLADVERSVLRLLADRGGSATATELSADEPRLRTTILLAAGKPYQATPNITSRVLFVLAAHGRIIRGKPIGSWVSQQYRWHLAEHWLPASATRPAPPSEAEARAELAGQWLERFGPAPLSDLRWWTGWTMTQVRHAVQELGAAEVDLGGAVGAGLPDDLAATPDPAPWVALLPALDPTVMGWADRSWFLHPHGPALFDSNGNAGPTVWLNGRVVGGWAQRGDGEIVLRLFEDVGADATALIEAEAGRLGSWLGAVRVIPRFRTPTERELSA
jgi:winged helix DNA-binding protein